MLSVATHAGENSLHRLESRCVWTRAARTHTKKKGVWLLVSGGATLTIGSDITVRGQGGTISGTFINQGTISSDETGTISISGTGWTNEGTVEATGGGRVTASGTSTNSGIYSVAFDSQFTVSGNYVQDENGELRVEIDSTSSFGNLAITGTATLDGALTAVFTAGSSVADGDSLELVTYSSATGSFATTDTEGLDGALTATFTVGTDATTVDIDG